MILSTNISNTPPNYRAFKSSIHRRVSTSFSYGWVAFIGCFCIVHARIASGGYDDVILIYVLAQVISVAAMDVVDLTAAVRSVEGPNKLAC
jgi:hypothetical protein